MMNHDIFISYSSKQKSIADGVCHYLEENGFKCWMAPRDIPVGSEYGDLIEEAIKVSKAVVLVFSEAASISKWVKGEINVAFTEDKPILPFRVDETEVKGGFRVMLNMMHWIDAFPHYADRLPDLLSSICGLLGSQPQKVLPSHVSSKSKNCPEGAINGVFSVSPTKKVYFSKGNLQYQISTGIWKFAEKQYDCLGDANNRFEFLKKGFRQVIVDKRDMIDLFGWGTGNNPSNCIKVSSAYPSFVDWGKNAIMNGGNCANLWRTLSSDEWKYVLEGRKTPLNIRYAKACVNFIKGLVLLPDNWDIITYRLNRTNVDEAGFGSNNVPVSRWMVLENAGAVFLPAAGFRYGTPTLGNYWSSSPGGIDDARFVSFCDTGLDADCWYRRYSGLSVRLVCPAEN